MAHFPVDDVKLVTSSRQCFFLYICQSMANDSQRQALFTRLCGTKPLIRPHVHGIHDLPQISPFGR